MPIQRKPESKWDDPEFRETIRRMWVDEKATYRQIAEATGATHGSISGGVRRMKLPMRSPKLYKAPVRKPKPYDKVDKLVRLVSTTQDTDIKRRDDDPVPVLLDGKPITVLTVRDSICRWIVHGNGIAAQFCGHAIQPGRSYCPDHFVRIVNHEASERFRKAWGLGSSARGA